MKNYMLLHSSSKKEKNPPTCPDFDQARGFFAHFAIMNRRTGRGRGAGTSAAGRRAGRSRASAGANGTTRGRASATGRRERRREAGPRPQAGGKGDAKPGLGRDEGAEADPPPPAPEGPSARERTAGAGARRRTAPDANCQPPATSRGWIAAVLAGQLLAQLLERPRASGAGIRVGGPTRDVNQHRAQDRRRRQRQHRA